jgi:tripartite-type tricarboxylate transporter receptor subunit TctC
MQTAQARHSWKNRLARCLAFVALGVAPLVLLPIAANAKPIELVVPIAPGGSTDGLARVIAEELAKKWNEPVLVISKPGAGVTVAARYVMEQPADGRTLFLGTAVMGVVPFQKVVPFDYNLFSPVVPLYNTPSVLYVRASLPVNNVREFVEWARKNPAGVSFGSTGVGSTTHIDAENFAATTGINMVHVPYAGSSATFPAMAGDHIDAAFASPSMNSQIAKSGAKVKALMVGSDKPLAAWPDVPVVDRSVMGDYRADNWGGIFLLARTPAPTLDKVNADINAVLALPSVREKFNSFALIPMGGSRESFAAFLASERTRLGALIKTRSIPIE